MTVLNLIARPLSWLNMLNQRNSARTQAATAATVAKTTPNVPAPLAKQVQWVDNFIKLPRRLDASCYQELLSVVKELDQSNSELVLDLCDVEQVELTGIFALHCTVLIVRGETPPDPEQGWHALRAVVEQNLAAGRQEKLKVINPCTRIDKLLRANHLDRCLLIEPGNESNQRLPLYN